MTGKAQLRDLVRDLGPGMAVQRFWRWLIVTGIGWSTRPDCETSAERREQLESFTLTSIGLQHGRSNVVALALAAIALGMAFRRRYFTHAALSALQAGVRIFRGHADSDLCGLRAGKSCGAVVLRPTVGPDRPPHHQLAGDRIRHRQRHCVRLRGEHAVAVCGAGAERLLHRAGVGDRHGLDRRTLRGYAARGRGADRGGGELLRLRRRAAHRRLAGGVCSGAAAPAVSHLSRPVVRDGASRYSSPPRRWQSPCASPRCR